MSPLFTESATDRELSAVNSENERNLDNDAWRFLQLEKSLSDPKHDYSKFGTGNLETLSKIPKSQGVDVRQALLDFHSKWYSANIMRLAVLGKGKSGILSILIYSYFDHKIYFRISG